MEPHILFFDIDGTLIPEITGKMTERTKEAIRLARENGHIAIINTGRSLAELDPDVMAAGFDGAVCGCGTYVFYKDQPLVEKTTKGKKAEELLQFLEECKVQPLLEGVKHFFISKEASHESLLAVQQGFGDKVNKKKRFYEEHPVEFQKLTVWLDEDSNLNGLKEELSDEYAFIPRAGDFYEIVPKGYTKATGMEHLAQHLGISKEHTLAIGDSSNDLTMLKAAGISVAMGNSCDAVKEQVDYVTKSVEEDGVAEALEYFGFTR